jgi:hypothetical protein
LTMKFRLRGTVDMPILRRGAKSNRFYSVN